MRIGPAVASTLGAVAAVAGCASLLSIPDRSLEWCDRAGNGHAFCEDFDHADAQAQWINASTAPDVANNVIVPSSDTPPNAIDISSAPLEADASVITGLLAADTSSRPLNHVHIEFDMRPVTVSLKTEGDTATGVGFFLFEADTFCLGLGLSPSGLGIIYLLNDECTVVGSAGVDGGFTAGTQGTTSVTLFPNSWIEGSWAHVTIDLKRNPDGSGVVSVSAPKIPGKFRDPPPIPPGSVPAEGTPTLAVAASIAGPSGPIELQFDNIAVDYLPN